MNHPIDTGPETDARTNSKQLKLLETLIDNIIERLQDKSCKPKVRDALLAIKLTQQVAKTSEAEGIFWDMIDDIRNSELSEPVSLEAQIRRTIIGLEDRVKNGILPIKVITEAFNQNRSEQTRLTPKRMSGLLSTMGFTRVRASNGARAIIWDDNLIFAPPEKVASSICSQEKRKHGKSEGDSINPLCISPPIREETTGSPPDIEDPQGRRSIGKQIHPEEHQRVVLSPLTSKIRKKGDLGGYDQSPAPTGNRDCRGVIDHACGLRKRGNYLFMPASPLRRGVKS